MDADDAERLDVLVSVDQGGACVLSAFGVFPVRHCRRCIASREGTADLGAPVAAEGCPFRLARHAERGAERAHGDRGDARRWRRDGG